ncbi:hypothetical protein J4467_00810 [Candidatus Woesearchaeota archaeon]|nr:hypothetical protein [Candidatus Woesearchaeota archaeon]
MEENNQNPFRPFRSSDQSQQSSPQVSPIKVQQSQRTSEHPTPIPSHVRKKDIFLMSFFGFIAAGVIFLLLLVITGVLTGYISIDMPELSGEEEVIPEETPVISEEVVNETVVEEVIEEEEVLPCDEDITLELDDGYKYGLKVITLKLAGDYSAQISIGGKSGFIDVGNTESINGLKITLVDSSESDQNAIIQVAC